MRRMVRWMLGTESPLSGTPTPSEIWRPDKEKMVAAAGFEPATKGWYVIGSNDIRGGGFRPWQLMSSWLLGSWLFGAVRTRPVFSDYKPKLRMRDC
jgi:hypothetical protein